MNEKIYKLEPGTEYEILADIEEAGGKVFLAGWRLIFIEEIHHDHAPGPTLLFRQESEFMPGSSREVGICLGDAQHDIHDNLSKYFRPSQENPRFPCPYCGRGLRTSKAQQCLHCGMDWHDPHNIVQNGDPNWNRFGLDPAKTYVVELIQHPGGLRKTNYREAELAPSGQAVLETEPASGQAFIDWGYYNFCKHLRLKDGRRFGFEAHGVWLTDAEIDFMRRRRPQDETPPWENGIAPLLPPK